MDVSIKHGYDCILQPEEKPLTKQFWCETDTKAEARLSWL